MVPKQRKSRSQTRKGRSHLAMRSVQAVQCPNCREPRHSHRACANCGFVRPGLALKGYEESEDS